MKRVKHPPRLAVRRKPQDVSSRKPETRRECCTIHRPDFTVPRGSAFSWKLPCGQSLLRDRIRNALPLFPLLLATASAPCAEQPFGNRKRNPHLLLLGDSISKKMTERFFTIAIALAALCAATDASTGESEMRAIVLLAPLSFFQNELSSILLSAIQKSATIDFLFC